MKKIVINIDKFFYSLSSIVLKRYCELANIEYTEKKDWRDYHIERTDPILVQVVENLSYEDQGGLFDSMELDRDDERKYAFLDVIEIPDDLDWVIYLIRGGREFVCERNTIWQSYKLLSDKYSSPIGPVAKNKKSKIKDYEYQIKLLEYKVGLLEDELESIKM